MTYNPKTLRDLGAYWVSQHGVNLGVVGNKAHTVGYHLGRDRIFDGPKGPGLGPLDYSVKTDRDKRGLTDGASAIDLGKLDGSLDELYAFSRWLVARCIGGACRDIREVIYSPDGKTVKRWSGVDNDIHSGAGNGDASHLTHTHISFFRDSENRDKVAYFAPFFAPEEPDVTQDYTHIDGKPDSGPGTVTIIEDGVSAIRPDGSLVALPNGDVKHSYGLVRFKGPGWPGEEAYLIGDDAAFLLKRNVRYAPTTGTNCDAKVNAALDHVAGPYAALGLAISEARPR